MRRALACLACVSMTIASLPLPARAGDWDARGPAQRFGSHSEFRAMGLIELPLGGRAGVWNAPRLGFDAGHFSANTRSFRRIPLADLRIGDGLELRLRGQPVLGSYGGSWDNSLESFENCFFGSESFQTLQCWSAFIVTAGIIGGGVVGGMCIAEAAGLCDDGEDDDEPLILPD
jgi:hypothetical protein